MKRKIIASACLLCLAMACRPLPSTVSPGVPLELKNSWAISFNRGDAVAVASLYEPDGQLLMSGSAPIRGAENIRRAIEAMIKEGLKVKIDTEDNVASGDIAYVSGTYRVMQAEGGAETEHGGYVEVWRRCKGTWRIALDVNAAGVPIIQGGPPAGR